MKREIFIGTTPTGLTFAEFEEAWKAGMTAEEMADVIEQRGVDEDLSRFILETRAKLRAKQN